MNAYYDNSLVTQLGVITLVAHQGGDALSGLYLSGSNFCHHPYVQNADLPIFQQARCELQAYFAGTLQEFTLPLDSEGTVFQKAVWKVLCQIPYGQVRDYRWLAAALPESVRGRGTSWRAVGQANGRNPLSIIVPCHRVIASDGSLGGYSSGLEAKDWLLKHEASNLALQ